MVRQHFVDGLPFIDNWGPSIVNCHRILEPFMEHMRTAMTERYWDDFDWLAQEVQRKLPVATIPPPNESAPNLPSAETG
jgi:hypothetical protein